MRVLITGGTGFLGTNLYQYIRRWIPETEVEVFSRRTGNDVRDYDQVEKSVRGKDYVFHLAAQTHVDFSLHDDLKDQLNFVDTNLKGTLHVLRACRKFNTRLIFVSTSEVYGTNQNPGKPMTEDHPLGSQAGIYAVSKLAADRLCWMEMKTHNMNVIIVRPFNMWGPGQSREKLIPKMINQGLEGKQLTVYGDGLQKRDYVHVEDVARALWLLRDSTKEVCNLASNKPIQILDIANMISRTLKVPVSHVDARPGEVRELHGGSLHEALVPTKFITDESMKELITWQKVNQPIVQPVL